MRIMDDDDDEMVVKAVNNYYFVENDEPVSFAELPILFEDDEGSNSTNRDIFLNGDTEDGLEKVHRKAVSWKLGLQEQQPVIYVLSKEGEWITLLKPRKSYEGIIRSILITVQMLHILKRNPDASEKELWLKLRPVVDKFEVEPSMKDFRLHNSLIKLFAERDESLAKSQLLLGFLEQKSCAKYSDSVESARKKPFITTDDDVDYEEDVDSLEETDFMDPVCAICDNGGDILGCDGPCMRSFHPTVESVGAGDCTSLNLNYTKAQLENMPKYLCENCKQKQHQCFACGELGSSGTSGTEVYQCVNAFCGHFYHPKCVAALLFPGNIIEASEFQKRIVAGEQFTCPAHRCLKCKEVEDRSNRDLQFALCRRCPKAFHRKCLPSSIKFGKDEDDDKDEDEDEDEDIIIRAWDKLLPNRILIYCEDHEIIEELGTPARNHLKYPVSQKERKIDVSKDRAKKLASTRRPGVTNSLKDQSQAKKSVTSADSTINLRKVGQVQMPQPVALKKMPQKDQGQPDRINLIGCDRSAMKGDPLPGSNFPCSKDILESTFPEVDDATMKRVISRTEKAISFLNVETISKRLTVPSTICPAKNIEKLITHAKVNRSVQAVVTALQKFDRGGRIEDAKEVCEPQALSQLKRWDNKLRVYLAPFIHGMRYTSFGRHFTKIEKLEEIVGKLHSYVQEGDMIVDFCCGANDFSTLMKKKLDEVGKVCNFKNFDLIAPKNNFCFEKRDWMTVGTDELPSGSNLIIGLNPPFGLKASLANKFIDKALSFKPKLIILIVPKETERLDKKVPPYELVWEDSSTLSGKSFYLPGSVDVFDRKMEQWNIEPPFLCLWSRPEWASKHRSIAEANGQLSCMDEIQDEVERPRFTVEAMERIVEDLKEQPLPLSEQNGKSGHEETENMDLDVKDNLPDKVEGFPPEKCLEVAYEEKTLRKDEKVARAVDAEDSSKGKRKLEVYISKSSKKSTVLGKNNVATTVEKVASDMSISPDRMDNAEQPPDKLQPKTSPASVDKKYATGKKELKDFPISINKNSSTCKMELKDAPISIDKNTTLCNKELKDAGTSVDKNSTTFKKKLKDPVTSVDKNCTFHKKEEVDKNYTACKKELKDAATLVDKNYTTCKKELKDSATSARKKELKDSATSARKKELKDSATSVRKKELKDATISVDKNFNSCKKDLKDAFKGQDFSLQDYADNVAENHPCTDEIADIALKYTASSSEGFYGSGGYRISDADNRNGNCRARVPEDRFSAGANISHASQNSQGSHAVYDRQRARLLSPERDQQSSLSFGAYDYAQRRDNRYGLPNPTAPMHSPFGLSASGSGMSAMDRYAPRLSETSVSGMPAMGRYAPRLGETTSGMSAMDRYAPRLGETNFAQAENPAPSAHHLGYGSSLLQRYGGNAAHLGYGGLHDILGATNSLAPDQPGFIPAQQYPPYHPGQPFPHYPYPGRR